MNRMIHTIHTYNHAIRDLLETLTLSQREMDINKGKYENSIKTDNEHLINLHRIAYETSAQVFLSQHKTYMELISKELTYQRN